MATFGKTDIGANEGNPSANYIQGSRYQLTEAGTVTEIVMYCKKWPAGCKVKCAIYDDNAGSPNNRKVVSDEVTIGALGAWEHFNVVPTLLVAGWYFLVWNSDTDFSVWYSAGAAGQSPYKASAYPTFPDPFGAPEGTEARAWSIYATYTPAAGGLSIPVAFHHLKSMNNAHVTDFIGAKMRNVILKTVNGSYS